MKKFLLTGAIFLLSSPMLAEAADFQLRQFFQAPFEAPARSSSWPSRLHFTPLTTLSEEEAIRQVQGSWETLFHCDGAPAAVTSTHPEALEDLPGRQVVELGSNTFSLLYAAGNEPLRTEWKDKGLRLTYLGAGRVMLELDLDSTGKLTVQLARVEETGQTVLLSERTSPEVPRACRDGSPASMIRVPLEPET